MLRWILLMFFLIAIGLIGYGYFFYSEIPANRDFYMGLGTFILFFVCIPLLLIYRRKRISIEKFLLTNESLKKMREHESKKKL